MHPSFEDYWSWYVTSWALYALGGGLLIWALFWDRAKCLGVLQFRCPKCWYDLRGLAGLVPLPENACCSECGRTIRTRRDLLRTRRHWRSIGFVIMLLLLAHVCHRLPLAKRYSWVVLIPSTALVLLPAQDASLDNFVYPNLHPRQENRPWREIRRRLRTHELWFWQEKILQIRVRWWLQRTTKYGVNDIERALAQRLRTQYITTEGWYQTQLEFVSQFEHSTGLEIMFVPTDDEDTPDISFTPSRWNGEHLLETLLDAMVGDEIRNYRNRSFSGWAIRDDQIIITPKNVMDEFTCSMMYDVGDIINCHPDDDLADVARIIQVYIHPGDWRDLGGQIASLSSVGDHLIVSTTPRHLQHIEILLAMLRHQREWNLDESHIEDLRRAEHFGAIAIRRYDTDDLRTLGYDFEEIGEFVRWTVDPEGWRDLGGDRGQMMTFHDLLIIQTSLAHHDRIDQLMDLVRGRIDSLPFNFNPADTDQKTNPTELQLRLYPIGDIAFTEEMITPLEDVIMDANYSADWYNYGGDSSWLKVYHDVAFVGTTQETHESIVRILAGLRTKIEQGLDPEQLLDMLRQKINRHENFPEYLEQFLSSDTPPPAD